MTVHNNDPEKIIDDQEDICQYQIWLLSGHDGITLNWDTNQVSTAQLYVGPNSHVFTKIRMFTYIQPVKFNVQILNDS